MLFSSRSLRRSILVFVVCVFVFAPRPSTASPDPTGILFDIMEMEFEALSDASRITINNLADNTFSQFENVYALVDAERGAVDLSDHETLMSYVDEMYEHPIIQSRAGLASSLDGVADVIDTGLAIKTVSEITELAEAGVNIVKASQELSALLKGDFRKYILKNCLQYGARRRAPALQNMIDTINADEFSHILELTHNIHALDISGKKESAAKGYEALMYLVQGEVADDYLANIKNGVWLKLAIQDFIVKRWQTDGTITDANYADFLQNRIYTKTTSGILFKVPAVNNDQIASDYYDLLFADDFDDLIPVYDFYVEQTYTSPNIYHLAIPETILEDVEHGQPNGIYYFLDGHNILTAYPDAISNRVDIIGTEVPKELTIDLSKYDALKTTAELTVTVTYTDATSTYSSDFLIYTPQVYDVDLISTPPQWSSEDFAMTLQICGDVTSGVHLNYKGDSATTSLWKTVYGELPEAISVAGACRQYEITVPGWDIMSYTGGNTDVTLKMDVAEVSTPEYSKQLVNTGDLDGDNLPDAWEVKYFAEVSAQTASDDFDADGADNLFEYQHGTDPTKAGAAGAIETFLFEQIPLSTGSILYDFDLSGIYWSNVVMKNVNLTVNENDAIINGNLYIKGGTLDLNGNTLIVAGNLYFENGIIAVSNGRLIIQGDLLIQGFDADESPMYSEGRFKMLNNDDYVLVYGDFVTDSNQHHGSYLTAGTLEVKGDFTQLSTTSGGVCNFRATGTHKVVLSGTDLQTISFDDPEYVKSVFKELEIKNESAAGVVFGSVFNAEILTVEPGANLADFVLGIDQCVPLVLQDDFTKKGDLWIKGTTLDLNGKSLTVTGNLYFEDGNIVINHGDLIVNGDVLIQRFDSEGASTYSEGRFKMLNDDDYVLVYGDFVTDSNQHHGSYLTAGTLEVKGNFTQLSTTGDGMRNFYTSGTHKVILSGSSLQIVNIDDPNYTYSRFTNLEVRNSNEVWFNTIIGVNNLFLHNCNPFSQVADSYFPDYDSDGYADNVDAFPTDGTRWLTDGLCLATTDDSDNDDLYDADEIRFFGSLDQNPDGDFDNDGIPNKWEIDHSLDPSVDDAALDFDEDSFTNLQEYVGGTAPDDNTSIPAAVINMVPVYNLLLF